MSESLFPELSSAPVPARARSARADAGLEHERGLFAAGAGSIIGLDEVGRGAWAGSVVVGAACLSPEWELLPGLRDSKFLSEAERLRLDGVLRARLTGFALGEATAPEIDALGILAALALAARRALAQLPEPDAILLDGPHDFLGMRKITPVVKGDQLCQSIAAASVLAKVWRDRAMVELESSWPGYDFARSKGYGSAAHREALISLGPCPEHRRSWKLPGLDSSQSELF